MNDSDDDSECDDDANTARIETCACIAMLQQHVTKDMLHSEASNSGHRGRGTWRVQRRWTDVTTLSSKSKFQCGFLCTITHYVSMNDYDVLQRWLRS